jgi:glycosyltransferase involved in cell wall biosynthesis
VSADGAPRATIVVTTRDRKDELRRMLRSALEQSAPDLEILVIDDGSSDGTSAMVRDEFPTVRIDRTEESLGLIEQRNRGAELASAPIVVSLDDDAVLPSPDTIEQTLRDFDHPRIGAVAIPFVDVRSSTVHRQEAPDMDGRWVTPSYIGTAHALRRDVFLAVGGYRGELRQMAEEPDYCLRMLDAGYLVRLGRADYLHHLESPKRDTPRLLALGRANDVLHGFNNVPMPYLIGRLAKVTVHSFVFAVRWRALRPVVRGLARGYRLGLPALRGRKPVHRSTYMLDHMLRKRGPLPLEEVEPRLRAPLSSRSSHA